MLLFILILSIQIYIGATNILTRSIPGYARIPAMKVAHPPVLKAVLIALVVGCGILVALAIRLAMSGKYLPLIFAILLWGPLAWGLWRLHPLARKVAVLLLWLVVIVLPIGLINPFAAMDGLVSVAPLQVAIPVYGVVAMALFCLHILGKHKKAFNRDG